MALLGEHSGIRGIALKQMLRSSQGVGCAVTVKFSCLLFHQGKWQSLPSFGKPGDREL